MQKATQLGKNRTGIQMSPMDTKKMLQETRTPEPPPGDASRIMELRTTYIQASGPVGTVPPPSTAKGAVKSGLKALTGKKAHVLIDRIGERLAFERSGTRLYEAFLTKCRAEANGSAKKFLSQVEHICQEEAEHFRMLAGCLEKMGADPTAQTPAANVTGVESTGLMQVVTDPMTSVAQSLHAILIAELADNDAWDELILLSRELGQDDMTKLFESACNEEREHLAAVRQWHQEATMQEAGIA